MKVTPDQIRAEHRELTFTVAECAVIADALEIADSCARSHIECECLAVGGSAESGWQWDTHTADPDVASLIKLELHYLDSRGLLRRDRTDPHIVSFNAAPQPGTS